ncbi:ArdC family protein [Psychrobacillus sp. MER TA 171]|uniref:ArdC-like ssDNA-binding domain-containing protein n=1 Tax=Psychrobacillus sp. MER TA 171 TaxID=2939577 RepID=UPI00204038A2|nr:ArdC family protein [Psychrobacillus sp. MER TA 171]MCM3358109.1 ArdC-like ssDNA-binding domain-containing protein [Psychrobacillus sp. MER TA 171]
MAKTSYKRKTAEEMQEEVQVLLDTLQTGVLNFQYEPEAFKAMLAMQSLIPTYSFRNMMLIRAQMPHARFIASFLKWKELNRSVRKGEKALRVLAPRIIKEIDEASGIEESKLIGYTSVPVFDVSQTDGDPLPIDDYKLELTGESEEAIRIFEWVKLLASEDNCPLKNGDAEGACGYYNRVEHYIMVDQNLSINHRAKTAVHELVHSRVHRHDTKSSKEEKECVAEGTAFIICSYFGLDTSNYSFEYVYGWSKDKGESLIKYGTMIQETASSLIAGFERVATALCMPLNGMRDVEQNKSVA